MALQLIKIEMVIIIDSTEEHHDEHNIEKHLCDEHRIW
jgi:hypothetical protein